MTFAQVLTTKMPVTEREAIGMQQARDLIASLLSSPEMVAGLQAFFLQRARTLYLEPSLNQVNVQEAARMLGQAQEAEKVVPALRSFLNDLKRLETAQRQAVHPASVPEPEDKGF